MTLLGGPPSEKCMKNDEKILSDGFLEFITSVARLHYVGAWYGGDPGTLSSLNSSKTVFFRYFSILVLFWGLVSRYGV